MYRGTLIHDLLETAERVWDSAAIRKCRTAQSAEPGEMDDSWASSQTKEFPEAPGLSTADRNLGLLLVFHSQLVRTLEPGHDLTDTIDVHQVRAVGPPKKVRVETIQQLFERPAVGLSLHTCCARSHDCDHAVFNPRIADIFLVNEKHPAGGFKQDL